LSEPVLFLSLLEELGIRLVNLSAGSLTTILTFNACFLYPPSDGYLPPEDPLVGVSRQMEGHAETETAISKSDIRGDRVQLPAGFSPPCSAGRGA